MIFLHGEVKTSSITDCREHKDTLVEFKTALQELMLKHKVIRVDVYLDALYMLRCFNEDKSFCNLNNVIT
jgi:hypothetical protein